METVCIFGLGYVGKEVASAVSDQGYRVTGVDTDPDVVASIKSGEQLENVDFNLVTTDGHAAADDADIIVEAVPTPVDDSKRIDLSAVTSVTEIIADIEYDTPPLYR